jgi:hypothetical protein
MANPTQPATIVRPHFHTKSVSSVRFKETSNNYQTLDHRKSMVGLSLEPVDPKVTQAEAKKARLKQYYFVNIKASKRKKMVVPKVVYPVKPKTKDGQT